MQIQRERQFQGGWNKYRRGRDTESVGCGRNKLRPLLLHFGVRKVRNGCQAISGSWWQCFWEGFSHHSPAPTLIQKSAGILSFAYAPRLPQPASYGSIPARCTWDVGWGYKKRGLWRAASGTEKHHLQITAREVRFRFLNGTFLYPLHFLHHLFS